MICLTIGQSQPGIFYLQKKKNYDFQKNTHFFNQETEDVLSWRLGMMDCNTKMGNETAG